VNAHDQPPSAAAHGIVPASASDIDVLSQVIADAFSPLAPCQWLIHDEAARRDILPGYFRMYVEHAMSDGLVHTTPGRHAAALWIPLGSQLPEPPEGYDELLAEVTGPWVERFVAFDAELDDHHLTGIEHHHLAILAVRPGRQGQGTGTALLDAHHAFLDQQGTTAYLEASDERSRALYLRHGYTDCGTPIQLPVGPRMFPMLRRPAGQQP
jgi:GNAT superfamily N-acetyltransferase